MKYLIPAAALIAVIASIAGAEIKHGHDAHAVEMPRAQLGDLLLENPIIRATPPNAPAAGGYLKMTNNGDAADTLVEASMDANVAGMLQLHNMTMDGDVMRMAQVKGGIEIPAGQTVQLAPGGLHLMIMGLEAPMADGAHHEITLSFARAGDVTLNFAVMDLKMVREIIGSGGAEQMPHERATDEGEHKHQGGE